MEELAKDISPVGCADTLIFKCLENFFNDSTRLLYY